VAIQAHPVTQSIHSVAIGRCSVALSAHPVHQLGQHPVYPYKHAQLGSKWLNLARFQHPPSQDRTETPSRTPKNAPLSPYQDKISQHLSRIRCNKSSHPPTRQGCCRCLFMVEKRCVFDARLEVHIRHDRHKGHSCKGIDK
jgi:hypothetical protein